MLRQARALTTFLLALAALHCSSGDDTEPAGGACHPPDQDGIVGGDTTLVVSVSDTGFAPVVVTAQNTAKITLTVTNTGTKPHDYVVQCLGSKGCTACFPDAAKVPPLAPGASTTVTFTAPEQEGIYQVTSTGDLFAAQFILK